MPALIWQLRIQKYFKMLSFLVIDVTLNARKVEIKEIHKVFYLEFQLLFMVSII
jgi:hypothetical protein